MGLDMYLWRVKKDNPDVDENLIYWRKANHIHGWFVRQVQLGTDDCNRYEVSINELKKLKSLCEEVKMSLKDLKINPETNKEIFDGTQIAMELLPPSKGFFFGSNLIDKVYVEDLTITIMKLEKLFTGPDNLDDYYYYYQSSW